MIVDLGCGTNKRCPIGVDVFPHPNVDYVCNIGFEPLPFADGSVDGFQAYDFVEHVPRAVYVRELDGKITTLRPLIQLHNEVFRCLRSGGTWEHITPVYPAKEVWQDPTHVTVWTDVSAMYFSSFDPVLLSSYGITCRFTLKSQTHVYGGTHLHVVMEKP